MDDSNEDVEQQQLRQRRIMEDSRKIPILFNGRLIFNAVITFVEGTGLRPLDIRQKLRDQFTFLHNGDKTVTAINRVKIYCYKGMMYLDYINDDPRLNTRLRMHNWPLQHVVGMRVKKTDPTPEQIAAYKQQMTKQPQPPLTRFVPSPEPDKNMNQFEVEDDGMEEGGTSSSNMEDVKKKNLQIM